MLTLEEKGSPGRSWHGAGGHSSLGEHPASLQHSGEKRWVHSPQLLCLLHSAWVIRASHKSNWALKKAYLLV